MNSNGNIDQRFVVLLHEVPEKSDRATHYDLMLEMGDVLWTWAIEELPKAGLILSALRLNDHRKDYLDYEGEISGNRGRVTRMMSGTFRILRNENPNAIAALLEIDFPNDLLERKLKVRIEKASQNQKYQIRFDAA